MATIAGLLQIIDTFIREFIVRPLCEFIFDNETRPAISHGNELSSKGLRLSKGALGTSGSCDVKANEKGHVSSTICLTQPFPPPPAGVDQEFCDVISS